MTKASKRLMSPAMIRARANVVALGYRASVVDQWPDRQVDAAWRLLQPLFVLRVATRLSPHEAAWRDQLNDAVARNLPLLKGSQANCIACGSKVGWGKLKRHLFERCRAVQGATLRGGTGGKAILSVAVEAPRPAKPSPRATSGRRRREARISTYDGTRVEGDDPGRDRGTDRTPDGQDSLTITSAEEKAAATAGRASGRHTAQQYITLIDQGYDGDEVKSWTFYHAKKVLDHNATHGVPASAKRKREERETRREAIRAALAAEQRDDRRRPTSSIVGRTSVAIRTGFARCPSCGVELKRKNLRVHMRKVHPVHATELPPPPAAGPTKKAKSKRRKRKIIRHGPLTTPKE
ncbi:hypothetical protein [Phycisphaera mikurensis]|uniref:hypothetical protein n=1 Tax=Phycisphaera mikurensis TaxID=547188 RepID=UPI00059B8343|nr:hypothetical protein [Phycisphaera mikurensis]MBB6443274.1 hypothetical protein [Phycisphaera mikurensis]